MLIKRGFDLFFCILFSPLIIVLCGIIGVFVKADSRGPIIYKQIRKGKNGKNFILYKFRTMISNADEKINDLLRDPEFAKEWKETQKLQNDPRITRIGRILRKTSLDELPQFYNILKGDMSLVGPRPIIDEEIVRYGKIYKDYCELLPGLTGVWQISGRNDTSYQRRLACDHYYANNWSMWLDIKVILKTFIVALKGFGAY